MYAGDSEAICPSCGRYIGPRDVCPYCGARVKRRLSVRLLKIAAVILAVVGLLTVRFVAVYIQTPVVKVSEIKPSMNYAHIKMTGIVTRYPSLYSDGSLSFWIDDGTGEIMVKAYRFEAQELLQSGNVPAMGDRVEVEGSIRIREDFQYLVIDLPSKLVIVKPNVSGSYSPSEIGLEHLGLKVEVVGTASGVRETSSGGIILYLEDVGGSIQIYIPPILRVLGFNETIMDGVRLKVVGYVSLYQGELEVVPGMPQEIEVLSQVFEYGRVSIAMVNETLVGSIIEIEGEIVEVRTYSSGTLVKLDDGTGTLDVWIPIEIYSEHPNVAMIAPTAKARAKGLLAVYKDKLEIKVSRVEDFQLLEEPAIEITSIASITESDEGRLFMIQAEITDVVQLSAGLKLLVSDGTGTIAVWIWNDLLEQITIADQFKPGVRIRVIGQLVIYKGTLELQPLSPESIEIIG